MYLADTEAAAAAAASQQPRPIRIPAPEECAPRRGPRLPRWEPRPRDPREAGQPGVRRGEFEGWHSPRLVTAPDGGPVRVRFNWCNELTSTSAALDPKTGRIQYAEGPHEKRYRRFLEVDPETHDFQFQIGTLVWQRRSGGTRKYTFDVGRQLCTGRIVLGEIKASRAFFHNEPDYRDMLERAEEFLAGFDIGFERIVGTDLQGVRDDVVRDIRADRLTFVSRDRIRAAKAVIASGGGRAPLGAVRAAVDPDPRVARALCNRMLVDRHIGFAINVHPTAATTVHVPQVPPAGSPDLRALEIEDRSS